MTALVLRWRALPPITTRWRGPALCPAAIQVPQAQALTAIVGPTGPQGPAGPVGETGATGPVGAQGPAGNPAAAGVYVQQARPTMPGPWVWWQTDGSGNIINLIVWDGNS